MLRWSSLLITCLFLSAPSLAQDIGRGQNLYNNNNCIQCHGPHGQGIPDQLGPRIGGQHDWYVLKALQDFKKRERQNPEMFPYIQNLGEQDFKDLAAYVATLSGRE